VMDAGEIARRLKIAAEAVEQVDLPDPLKQLAFERALDAAGLVGSASSPSGPGEASSSSAPHDVAIEGPLATIASRLGLQVDAVEQIYEDDADAGVRLIIKRTMLPHPDQKAASMRQIALLVASGRQVAGIEEYTAYSLIRDECAEVKVLDPSNFSTEIGKLGMRRRGPRNKQEAKVNRHHLDETAELIRTMTSASVTS
jgi:hypothetical protein